MKNLVLHVQQYNALYHMWRDRDTLIIGVSGGHDSMCLLDVMAHIARKEHLTIVVAHVNYGLRGPHADADEKLVRETARHHGMRYHVTHPARRSTISENTMRTARYAFFHKLRTRYRARAVLVAHTQNDQAETVLLNLLRGTGTNGLGGMQPLSSTHIARPFLAVTRNDVKYYIQKHHLTSHTDTTNTDTAYTRNRIRHRLIPYLARHYNPNIVATLARTAEVCATAPHPIVPFWHHDHATHTITFATDTFINLSPAQQYQALRAIVTAIHGSTRNLTKGLCDELRKVITSTTPKNHRFTSKNLKITTKNGTVCVGRAENIA